MKTAVSLRHVYFQIMLWSLGVAAAAGFIAMLVASYDVVGRVAATAFATAAASGILWRLEAMVDDADKSVYGLLGMVAATGICYLLSLFGIWAEEDRWRWWLTVGALGITAPAAFGSLQLIAKRRDVLAADCIEVAGPAATNADAGYVELLARRNMTTSPKNIAPHDRKRSRGRRRSHEVAP